jgi:ATP-dependent helicase/nuclease subunit A
MTVAGFVDDEDRRRIAEDLDATLVVEAAAGTGKTTALVSRLLSLLATGTTTLARLVAVTFTEKAAGELKLRLRGAIEERRAGADDVVAARLTQALSELEVAHIGTIHGFCADLLRERPIEAGLDPRFTVVEEDGARAVYDAAFQAWFDQVLADPPDGVRRQLRAPTTGRSNPRRDLYDAGFRLLDRRDFRGAWSRPPFDRIAALDEAVAAVRALAVFGDAVGGGDSPLARAARAAAAYEVELDAREAIAARDYDAIEFELPPLRKALGDWGKGSGRVGRANAAEVLAARDHANTVLNRVIAACEADRAAALHDELGPLVSEYDHRKNRAGVVDFFDLLSRTRDLLVQDDAVRRALQRRFTHLLVDEFQDTDPLQADILLLLAASDPDERDPERVTPRAGALFVVGDPKQSIYRFRRADVAFYLRVRDRLVGAGAERLFLRTSFRSDPRIQQFVNAAFDVAFRGEHQPGPVPLAPARAVFPEQPAVVALPVPAPYQTTWGRPKVTSDAIHRSFPPAVGAFVAWLVKESGWTVEDPEKKARRPVESRDVCLLFSRFSGGIPTPYVEALEAHGLPHVLVGGRSLAEREEFQAVRTALTAIEWPGDELAVYGALRGPLFALSDESLFRWKETVGRLSPVARRDDVPADLAEVARALDALRELRKGRNRRPIADTVAAMLDRTRAHAGLALWGSGGGQVLANAIRVTELARRFEAAGASSFRAFVQHLDGLAERGEGEAPVVEEGTDGVRLITVHKAKGLEFPVVILCDPGYRADKRPPSRWVDPESKRWVEPLCDCLPHDLALHADVVAAQDQAERDRLVYVAATRARDLLVVGAVATAQHPGWTGTLHVATYPPASVWKDVGPCPGGPEFGGDATPDRPEAALDDEGVPPGRHGFGDVDLVWWDPSVLPEPDDRNAGFRAADQQLLVEDQVGIAAAGRERHRRWREQQEAARDAGKRPTETVTTPTAWAAGHAASRAVTWEHVDPEPGRPHGKAFGTLVHAILAAVPLDADLHAARAVAKVYGRLVAAGDAEVEAAAVAVARALRHPLFDRVRASGDVRHEMDVTTRRSDGVVVEGTADLVFREGDHFVVVDYKTDLDVGERAAAYEAQVSLYADLIALATGRDVDAVLISV